MYGLPQAGKLSNDQLQAFLAPHGYWPCPITLGLWAHNSCPIHFTLVVDDFAVQYSNCDDAEHLMAALQDHYQVTEDWSASCYCRMSLQWDYIHCMVNLSMPGYIKHALLHFQHPHPACPGYSPHPWQKPDYGACTQYAPAEDLSPVLDTSDTKQVPEVIGVLCLGCQFNNVGSARYIGHPTGKRHPCNHGHPHSTPQLLCYQPQCHCLFPYQ